MLLFASSPLFSTGCLEGNCKNGQGVYLYKSGAKYEGNFINSKIEGYGVLHYSSGEVYRGNWKNQRRHGKGTFYYLNGDVYKGQYDYNLKQGKGRYITDDKVVYEGTWSKDKRHGTFQVYHLDGRKDQISYFEGNLTGGSEPAGQIVSTNSTHAKKQRVEQKPKVETKVKVQNKQRPSIADLDVNDKNLKNCNESVCNSGIGKFVYRDKSVYVGEHKNGYPHGTGKCYYANGDYYTGEWQNHGPHGKGVMHFKSGTVYGAIWNNGKPVEEIAPEEHLAIDDSQNKIDRDKEIKIRAVIVGISRYNHMPALKYADDDAYHIYAFLKSPEGGALPDDQINLLIDEDATRNNIMAAVIDQFMKADENDVVLLYYSGHGLDGALIPIDFDGFNNRLMHEDLKDVLDKSQAKNKIVFADACFSGSLLASKSPYVESVQNFYSKIDETRPGTAFLMSSKEEEVSLESGGLRKGIYSHYLIEGLRGNADVNNNKIVTISELYNYVYEQVRIYSGNTQSPILAGDFDRNMPVANIRY